MGTGHLLDTNTIIGYLGHRIPSPGLEALTAIIDRAPHISVISQIELLRFNDTPENEKAMADFVSSSIIYPLSSNTVWKTITVCKQITVKIKLPDAVIAATALLEDLTLVTRNIKDFKHIPGLRLLNPWDSTFLS